jgi:hypothetical protein
MDPPFPERKSIQFNDVGALRKKTLIVTVLSARKKKPV